MSIHKSLLVTFLFNFAIVPLAAQTISSRLVDAKTQKGIPYATVQYGEYQGVITNEEGRFSFVLAEGIEIKGASMNNGLLHVELIRHIPEPEIRNIKIEGPEDKVSKPKTIDVDTTT